MKAVGAFMDVWGGRLLLVVLEMVDAVLTVPLPTPELPSTQLLLAWEEEDDDCGFGIPRLSEGMKMGGPRSLVSRPMWGVIWWIAGGLMMVP